MDNESNQAKSALITALAQARSGMGAGVTGIQSDLNLKAKLKRSVRRNVGTWLTGAAFGGLVLSAFTGRSGRKNKKRRREIEQKTDSGKASSGLLMATTKVLFKVTKPALIGLATRYLARRAEKY